MTLITFNAPRVALYFLEEIKGWKVLLGAEGTGMLFKNIVWAEHRRSSAGFSGGIAATLTLNRILECGLIFPCVQPL